MQSASGGIVRRRSQRQAGGAPGLRAAVEQARIAAAGLAQIEGGQRRHARLVGHQHRGLAPVRRRGDARPDRPHGVGDVTLAVGHAGAQIDDLRLTVAQDLCQLGRSDRSQRDLCGRTCGTPPREFAGSGDAAFEHIGLVPELAQPGRDHRRPDVLRIGQHQPCAPDAHPLVGRLDQLAARSVREARHGVCGKLLGRAHVEEIGRARGVGEPGVGLAGSDEIHLVDAARLRARASSSAV